ncbi:hypothetical protein COBT_002497, partial [Conglomerata obtusa]
MTGDTYTFLCKLLILNKVLCTEGHGIEDKTVHSIYHEDHELNVPLIYNIRENKSQYIKTILNDTENIANQFMRYHYAIITFENLDTVDSKTISKAFSSSFKPKNFEIKYNIYAQFDSISIKNMYLTECEYFARFICAFKGALWLENDFNEKMKIEKPESESMIYYHRNGNCENLIELLQKPY